ncbi:CHAT domain-containing protein [Candidatus Magnetomonas plexicatena]|uniref:CHAT domain-containing protein n=1 Tax=Candidatus Magnetomonas plexicatena TaxID=2552947 RepID=UPI001C760DF1|nr:CHAT domain-containing protein [Nitrospirales bacterium LBB_01]
MQWTNVTLNIPDDKKKELKELGSKFTEAMEKDGTADNKIIEPLKIEMSKIINADSDVKTILKDAVTKGSHHVLRLLDNDNEILNLPWSLAVESDTNTRLGDIETLHILKTPTAINNKKSADFTPKAAPLKILIMISSPIDLSYKSRLAQEDEEYEILKAFEPLLKTGHLQIDYTDDGSIEALKSKIKANQYHILHFSGHGVFKDGKGSLHLENHYTLKGERVNEDDFAKAVNSNSGYKIPLVVLSSCQTAQGGSDAILSGVTGKLLNVETPAVVSMGMSVLDRHAILFTAALYTELSNGQSIPEAFSTALNRLKVYEQQQALKSSHATQQWMIPNLYVSRQIENIVDWDSAPAPLELTTYQYVTEGKQISMSHKAGFMFVGRRETKAKVFEPFFGKKPIFLKGQGGVGKSTMAEYMVQRAITKNPAKTVPVIITDKVRSFDDILKVIEAAMLKTSSEKMLNATISTRAIPEAILRVDSMLRMFSPDFKPVLVFDNLETFQDVSTGEFLPEYNDIYETIKHLCSEKIVQLVLTGRYVIPGLANLIEVNLNNIGFNDYWKKCQYLELFEIHHELNKKFYLDTIFDKQEAEFVDLVRFLHENLGGNFRALEFFNEIYKAKKFEIKESLKTIKDMKADLAAKVKDVRSEMALNLVFNELLKLVSFDQRRALYLLSNFRIPVQMKALTTQPENDGLINFDAALLHLGNLTLIEISTVKTSDTDVVKYYFVTPIIKDLLKEHDGSIAEEDILKKTGFPLGGGNDKEGASSSVTQSSSVIPSSTVIPAKAGIQSLKVNFSNKIAGDYYDDFVKHSGGGLTEREEAFYHYHKAGVKDKINEIGARLSRYYYNSSLYATAFHYCKAVYDLLKLESDLNVLNRMGLILQLYGDLDGALKIYLDIEKIARAEGKRNWEGTILNNIYGIYYAKGNYENALKYLTESLKITRGIGDKQGEATTLFNLAMLYDATGKPTESAQCLTEVKEINKTLKSYEISQALKRAGIEG